VEALWGWLHLDERRSAEKAELAGVASIIEAHGADLRTDRNFALAISRKVIDRATQAPSIVESPGGSIWVAMTGQIDNRKELLRDLESRGRRLASGLDAEIVLRLYEENGACCGRRIDGLFNIAIWNVTAQKLTLICDKVGGVRSMYYYRDSNRFAFGSAVKAIIAHPDVERGVDSGVLPDLFWVGHPIPPHTLLRNVHVLTAGCYVECQGKRVTTGRYWRRNFRVTHGVSSDALERQYLEALDHAVRRAMDTTGALGVMLSGGVDSAALVSLMRRAGAGRIRTFSIHIGDPATNDRAGSQRIADLYATDHCSIDHLDASCLDILPEMIWHFESAGHSFYPTYWLCRHAVLEVDTLLGGYGNDLVWGCCAPVRKHEWRRLFSRAVAQDRFLNVRRLLPLAEVRRILPSAPSTEWTLIHKLSCFVTRTGHPLNDYIVLDEAMFGEQVIHRELGKILVEAHLIWPRMPYLDAGVGAIADSVAPEAKMVVDAAGRVELKHFFKQVMRRQAILPEEIISREKTWMATPTSEWLREGLGEVIEAILLAPQARVREFFDAHEIKRRIQEHRTGTWDHSLCLMMLTGFELWHRVFIDAPTVRKPEMTLAQIARGDII
jgi:asparagine synthase (glutamine-hydrolysing)